MTYSNCAAYDISAATPAPNAITTVDGLTTIAAVTVNTLQDWSAFPDVSITISLSANPFPYTTLFRSTFSGVIQDGGNVGSLFKDGTGKLTLAGGNTYTGGTTIWAGT